MGSSGKARKQRKPGVRLTGGWRCNSPSWHLMVAKHIPDYRAQRTIAKAPARRTVRRTPGAYGLIEGSLVIGRR